MQRRPKYPIERLREEILLIDSILDAPLDIHLIGGCAMGLSGLKPATKDIDVIVSSEEDFKSLEHALIQGGYSPPATIDDTYAEMGIHGVFDKHGTSQWDVFINVVCRKLRLSPGMTRRARPGVTQTEKLQVHLVHPSDIFVFKSITPRPDDREDMAVIHSRGLVDWGTVLSEMQWQSDPRQRVWTPAFLEAMEEFRDTHGATIPILDELESLAERQAYQRVLLDKAGRTGLARNELVESIAEDPAWVNQLVEDLLAKGLLVNSTEDKLRAGGSVQF